MCGIIGQIAKSTIEQNQFCLKRDTLHHRGPDGKGAVFLQNNTIALGHTRLSFFDLSENGQQPMADANKQVWITYNGEIYNFRELKETLTQMGCNFHTQTDTEVILEGYKVWGIAVLQKLKGMFALALLDLQQQKLFLVRDRFGIKPLYYSSAFGEFIFASELKAIVKHSNHQYHVDFSAFADYFTYRYIPSPKTIWQEVAKLPPAHYLEYNIASSSYSIHEYWSINYQKRIGSKEELAYKYGQKLEQSVMLHARADVPVGSFLSGGYDSSAIAYLLAKNNYLPQTFSIGFNNWEKSEDQYAAVVAEKFGLNHHPLIVSENDLDLANIMPDVYDEPIADISILPTYLVSKNARKYVKAVMGGEGADELLGGYTWQKDWFREHPATWKQKLFGLSDNHPETLIPYYAKAMAMGYFDSAEQQQLLRKDYHHAITNDAHWFYRLQHKTELSAFQAIQHLDIKCFMGELVLTKIDRASMANSLEVRVPFLDHELYELVLAHQESCYMDANTTKYILHENIKQVLPKTILNRQKQGFVGPDSFYMQIEWYKSNLGQATLIKEGIINEEYYLQLLTQQDHWRLWKLLVMEKWFNRWAL